MPTLDSTGLWISAGGVGACGASATWVSSKLVERHVQLLPATVAPDDDLDVGTRRLGPDQARQCQGIVDGLTIDLDDDVARLDAGLGRRGAFARLGDQGAASRRQADAVGDVAGHVLDVDAEESRASRVRHP